MFVNHRSLFCLLLLTLNQFLVLLVTCELMPLIILNATAIYIMFILRYRYSMSLPFVASLAIQTYLNAYSFALQMFVKLFRVNFIVNMFTNYSHEMNNAYQYLLLKILLSRFIYNPYLCRLDVELITIRFYSTNCLNDKYKLFLPIANQSNIAYSCLYCNQRYCRSPSQLDKSTLPTVYFYKTILISYPPIFYKDTYPHIIIASLDV